MKLKLTLAFAAGLLTAVILGVLGFGRPAALVECQTGDLTQGAAPTSRAAKEMFSGWIHQVHACHIGDYLVVAPRQAGMSDILVSRNGKPVLIVSGTETMVMDDDHVVYDREPGKKLSFAAYSPAQRSWIEHVDLNADGTLDWRTTEGSHGALRHEVHLGDRWLEVVRRNGQNGTVLDGRFMSIEEARAQLGAGNALAVGRSDRLRLR